MIESLPNRSGRRVKNELITFHIDDGSVEVYWSWRFEEDTEFDYSDDVLRPATIQYMSDYCVAFNKPFYF